MSNKLFYPISLVLVLALAGFAQAELLLNGGFEAGLDSWKVWGGGDGEGGWWEDYHANVVEDGTAHSGNKYLEAGLADPGWSWWSWQGFWANQEHPVTEGTTYEISAWVRAADADGAPTLIADGISINWEWRDAAPVGGTTTDDRGARFSNLFYAFDLTEEWTYVSSIEVAPAGAKGLSVSFYASAGVNFDLDDASFVEVLPEPLVSNGSFEEDEAILDDPDWVQWCTWNPAEGAGSNATIVDTDAIDGARSLMIEPRGTDAGHFYVIYQPIPLEVGTDYITSFWAKAAVPRPLDVTMKAADNSVSWVSTTFQLTTDWAEYSLSGVAENATAKIDFACAATTDTIWLDLVSMDEEVVLPPSLLINGSFEEDEAILDDPDWVQWCTWNPAEGAGSNATIVDTDSIDGARSLMIEPRGTEAGHFYVIYQPIPLEVGRDYVTSFWAKAAVPRSLDVTMKAADNSVSWVSTTFQLTTDWAEYSLSGVAENATAKIDFACAATTDTIWLDLVSLYAAGAGPPPPLVANGSFEEDEAILDDPDWLAWWTWNDPAAAGSNATIVDTDFVHGARSLMIEPQGPGTDGWHFMVANSPLALEVGTDYTTSFWAKAAVPRPLTVQTKATDNSVTWGGTQFDLTTDWAEYSISAPAENATAKLEFHCAATNDTLWLDLVSVDAAEGLVVNGSFEDGFAQWWTWGWEGGLASTYEIDPTTSIDGANSCRVDPVGGGENWYFMIINSPIPLEIGTTYTASLWAKAEEPRSIAAKLKAEDNSVDWGETTFEVTTEWAEYSFTAEALNESAKFEIHCGNAITVWLDFVNIYEGEYDPGIVPAGSVDARAPSPTDGAIDVSRDVTLSWSSGQSAVTHEVYLGTDVTDVNNADITDATGIYRGSQDLGATSYTPAESPLEWGQTYYWRVDEVNEADPNSPWKGTVWSFTIINHIVVDDFESYNDIPLGEPGSNLVYVAWVDGFDNPATNGSTIGYPTGASMETGIVHSGAQSVPLKYDNITAGLSEVTRTLNADWTQDGVLTLTLFYRGKLTNDAEPMYIALNGTVIPHDNPSAARASGWNQWDILLQDFVDLGVNLANVSTMSIGFGNKANPVAGGSGDVFIDDVRLYRSLPVGTEPEPDPVDPGVANLVASYSFEDNTQDGSGNGLDGTSIGPIFVQGIVGMALSFDGVNDNVDCGNNAAFDITEQITLSAWVNTNDAGNGQHNPYVGKGDHAYALKHASGNSIEFFIYDGGWHTANASVDSSFNGDWHHVAGTYDGIEAKTYVDGILGATNAHVGAIEVQTHNLTMGNNSEEGGRFYDGALDEVKIYDRALSKAEIRFLVGN